MSKRIGLKHIGTLPQALAHVGLVRAMRHYLKADAPFRRNDAGPTGSASNFGCL